MATLVSKAAYAKLHAKSAQAAKKWEAKGCLVLQGGKVNVERSDELMRHACLGRFAGPINQPPKHQPAAPTINPTPALEALVDADPDQVERTLNAFVDQLLNGNYADILTANTVKENALALRRVLEAKQAAGSLIPLEAAERTFFETARQMRDAWTNFPTRVGPLIAAELETPSDRLVEVLTAHVHQHLADLGEPEPRFGGAGSA